MDKLASVQNERILFIFHVILMEFYVHVESRREMSFHVDTAPDEFKQFDIK